MLPFPTFMGTANSMDMQHLEVVHGVPNEVDVDSIEVTETKIRYDMVWHDPNFGRVEQHLKDFGINVVTVTGELAGVRVGMFFAGRPVAGATRRAVTPTATTSCRSRPPRCRACRRRSSTDSSTWRTRTHAG